MTENIMYQQAMVMIERAYRAQMRGELGEAIELYQRSIEMHPTAEAHTFLGWTYSMLNRYDDAIDACEQAIAVDPSFGNPYNDIGSYLIELGRPEEALPWLEDALEATRYELPHVALFNLGRVYQQLGRFATALDYYGRALAHDPLFRPALNARYTLLGRLN